jgi:hypothetical protein
MQRTTQFPEPSKPVSPSVLRAFSDREREYLTEDLIQAPDQADTYHRERLNRLVARYHINSRRFIEGIVKHPQMEEHFRKQIAIGQQATALFCEYFNERYGVEPTAGLEATWGPNPTEQLVISPVPEAREVGIEILQASYAEQVAVAAVAA